VGRDAVVTIEQRLARMRLPTTKGICRWCGEPTAKPRRTWHDECVEQYLMLASPAVVRSRLFERDQGVCWECGLDCDALEAELFRLRVAGGSDGMGMYSERWRDFLRQMGLERLWNRTAWEAHHLVAVADGGHGWDLDNYLSLCWQCHARETRRQHRLWARQRADARQPLIAARQALLRIIKWRQQQLGRRMQPILFAKGKP